MDDGYETGPQSTLSSSTSTKSRSPRRSHSSAEHPPVQSKRSVGSGSLPSPALITDEARRVLEAFLQRSQSMDRGSTGSVAALVPRHLEVIEEIRHTRIRTDSYRVAHNGDSLDEVDGVVVRVAVQSEEGPPPVITDLSMQHHHTPAHTTDVDVSLRTVDGQTRVLHTHVTHPPLTTAAEAVTTGAAEMYIDSAISRQASQVDGPIAANGLASAAENGVRTIQDEERPSTAAYDGDQERAVSAAGDKNKKKKKKMSRESIRTWLRTLRRKDDEQFTAQSPEDCELDMFIQSDYDARAYTPMKPKLFTMESTSSSTSTSTFGSGAPTRSIVRPEDKPRRKKRKLRRRMSQKPVEGVSFFHQLFRIKPRNRSLLASSEPTMGIHRNSSLIADMLAAQEAQAATTAPTPDSEAGMDIDGAMSLPDLQDQTERQEVGEIFRSAIEKRNSSGSGIKIEASTSAVVKRVSSGGDEVDHTVSTTQTKQVDRTTLRLDFSSSSQSSGPGQGMLSSPDQVGSDGVASKRDVDKVARLLDKLADEINISFSSDPARNRSDSAPSFHGARRYSLPDNNPNKSLVVRRDRPGSARGRTTASESGDTRTVATSASTPLLGDVQGDEFDPKRALKAKAQRIRHQSNECIVTEDLLDQLLETETYEDFSSLLRYWFKHSGVNWKQIALLYHLARKLVRQLSKIEGNEEQVERIKEFTMRYFQLNFAEFVIRRGGWRNVIEDTEDSELD